MTANPDALDAQRADTRTSGENPIKAIATILAILVAAAAVSLSVLHASSVAHQDSQNQQKILRDIRGIDCTDSTTCTKFNY